MESGEWRGEWERESGEWRMESESEMRDVTNFTFSSKSEASNKFVKPKSRVSFCPPLS